MHMLPVRMHTHGIAFASVRDKVFGRRFLGPVEHAYMARELEAKACLEPFLRFLQCIATAVDAVRHWPEAGQIPEGRVKLVTKKQGFRKALKIQLDETDIFRNA